MAVSHFWLLKKPAQALEMPAGHDHNGLGALIILSVISMIVLTVIFGPDALVIWLGVDTFEHDPKSFFKLSSDDFKRYGSTIVALMLPTLFIMEGGYAVDEIGINTVNVLQGYEGL